MRANNYNKEQKIYPLPIGEFRWHYKHLSDESMRTTTRVDRINGLFNYVKQIKNTLVGCFFSVYIKKVYKVNKKES